MSDLTMSVKLQGRPTNFRAASAPYRTLKAIQVRFDMGSREPALHLGPIVVAVMVSLVLWALVFHLLGLV